MDKRREHIHLLRMALVVLAKGILASEMVPVLRSLSQLSRHIGHVCDQLCDIVGGDGDELAVFAASSFDGLENISQFLASQSGILFEIRCACVCQLHVLGKGNRIIVSVLSYLCDSSREARSPTSGTGGSGMTKGPGCVDSASSSYFAVT